MKNFLTSIFIGLCLVFLPATQATAIIDFDLDTYWDIAAISAGYDYGGFDGDGITESFSELSYVADTTSHVNTSTGSILDFGNGYIDSLIFSSGNTSGDSEGLNQTPGGYEVTFAWDNLAGYIDPVLTTPLQQVSKYTSGTIDFFLDFSLNGTLGNNFAVTDDSGITDGTLIATVEITEGHNTINYDTAGNITGGSYNLTGVFSPNSNFYDNFWFDSSDGNDLKEKFVQFEFLYANTNGDNNAQTLVQTNTPGTTSGGFDYDFTIDSRHDSSIGVGPIPEPSTIILLGAGLLGTGIMLRRKNRK